MSDSVERRVAALERRLTFAGFNRFYGALAPIVLTLAFLPVYADLTKADLDPDLRGPEGDVVAQEYGSLWDLVVLERDSQFIIVVVLVLVILLVVAAFRVRSAPLPAWIAVAAALTAVLLLLNPVRGTEPALAEAGIAMVVISWCVTALSVSHVIMLYVRPPAPETDGS